MIAENTLDKSKLISELKEIHIGLVEVYKEIFEYKYKTSKTFKAFIDKEYEENGISSKEQQAWNDNFCHRASYTLLNKILFIRICEDKGFMLNPEDYVAGEPKDPHIGEKLSKIGLQKWANLVTNYTLGELVKFAFLDMKRSYSNIVLYKEDKYEILNPTNEELSLKYLGGDEETRQIVVQFESVLNSIVEKLDTNTFNFRNTDGNILGDVYEKFMDRETRKAIGQFYTPEFVIEYILNNTVAEADVVENPFVSVADIACGSGHFLIMAYDILREKFINSLEQLREKYAEEVYTIKVNGKREEVKGSDYWKKENLHYHILKHCIYGADIDSFAVQLTTINLLLKDLDNFTDELNIIECDSLIKWEVDFNWKDLKEQFKEEFETIVTTQTNLLGEEEHIEIKQKKERFILKKDISGVQTEEIITWEKAEKLISLFEFWNKKFNYIVGNPPYGTILTKEVTEYVRRRSNVLKGEVDAYMAFYSRALDLIKPGGLIGFINPDSWLTNVHADVFREYLISELTIITIFDLYKPFKDAKDTRVHIVILKSIKTTNNYDINVMIIDKHCDVEDKNSIRVTKEMKVSSGYLKKRVDIGFTLYQDSSEINVINKMENSSIKVDDKYTVQYGLRTGCNEKFITETDESLYRIVSGADIIPFIFNWHPKYLVDSSIVSDELLERVRSESKIIIQRVRTNSKRNDCQWVESNIFPNNYLGLDSTTMIFQNSKQYSIYFLVFLLNSKLLNSYYKMNFTDVSIKPTYLKKLPLPILGCKEYEHFEPMYLKVTEVRKWEIQGTFNKIIKDFIEYKKFEIDKDFILFSENIRLALLYKLEYDEYETLYKKMQEKEYGNRELTLLKQYWKVINLNNYRDICNKVIQETIEDLRSIVDVEYLQMNKTNLLKVAETIGCEIISLEFMVKEYCKSISDLEHWKYYDLTELNNYINRYIKGHITTLLKRESRYMNIDEIRVGIAKEIDNFDELIEVLRLDDNTRKIVDLLKDIMSKDLYTFSAYKKTSKNKINKEFVKYYDNINYGLSEWSDEYHKNYFLDAVEKYTVNNPNEKKARDILGLFEDLDIQDKQDYIEIIEGKIKRAFH